MKPYIVLNFASSLDGKISGENGKQFKFSNLEDMERVHRLRSESDIIVVGKNTVNMDDPKLTINPKYFQSENIPDVCILDSHLRVNTNARLFKYKRNVVIFCGSSATLEDFRGTFESNVILKKAPSQVPDARYVADELGSMGYRTVMVEGGMSIITSFIKADVWDEIDIFYSPVLIGNAGVPMLDRVPSPISFENIEVTKLGNGFLVKIKKGLRKH
ncbi:MAG: RibD family protein [Thermoplasmatales archaeon]